eukprot:UN03779
MRFIGLIMTVNFLICTTLWVNTCILNVIVGVTFPHQTLQICTLYNNDVHQTMDFYHKIWPILLGAQDFIVSITTVSVFASHIRKLAAHSTASGSNMYDMDIEFEMIIRKLIVLGLIAILSTSIFYTFAVPFYPNLTFLLPIDCTINSLCTLLLLEYGKDVYNVLCYVTDKCLLITLGHKVPIIQNLANTAGIDIRMDTPMGKKKIPSHSPQTSTGTMSTCTMSKQRRSTILKFESGP